MSQRSFFSTVLAVLTCSGLAAGQNTGPARLPELVVKPTADFEITGAGKHDAWNQTDWTSLGKRGTEGTDNATRVKILYSPKGIYVLMDAADRRISATMTADFENLWTEDVFEVFLWPDEKQPVYFEYEISPLGHELPILIPNFGGQFYGWRPWHYDGERRTRKATVAIGGPKQSGAAITGWRAEVFFPYDLLKPLTNVPPKPGSRWRANFYRMDYDGDKPASWDWARVGPSFHEFQKFGVLVFE